MAAAYAFERAGGVKVVSLEKKRLQRLCRLSEDCRQTDLREESHSFLAFQTAEQGPLSGNLGRQILIQKEDRVSRIV